MEATDKEFKDRIVRDLKLGNVEVLFTKKDGSERKMLCTLVNIPAEHQPKNEVEYAENTVRVFDIEKQGWRSFRLDSVKSVTSL